MGTSKGFFKDIVVARWRIDVVVDNTAITESPPVWEIEQPEWDNVLAVNLRGVSSGCQLVVSVIA